MMTDAKIIARAPGPLFTIEECRRQCEVLAIDGDSDGDATHPDDELILGYLEAAIDMAEDFTGLAISQKTYEVALDQFPSGRRPQWTPWIELPVSPFVSVESFIVGVESDADTLDNGTDYFVDSYGQFARLRPVSTWPAVATGFGQIVIQFVAGYEVDSDGHAAVPPAIRQAIMLALGDWYKNREDSNDKQLFVLPNGSQMLLRPKRVRLGMA